MKLRKASPYTIQSESHGHKIAVVEATQGLTFTLDADDWAYVRQHFGVTWRALSDGKGRTYVAAARHGSETPLTLARAILCPESGEIVRYRDGNRLNLRRRNLYVEHGRAKHAVQDVGERWNMKAA